MIRSEVHEWDLKIRQFTLNEKTSVVRSIVKHDDRVISPVSIFGIQVLTKLHHEKQEGVCIVLPFVDCEEKFTKVTDARNYV